MAESYSEARHELSPFSDHPQSPLTAMEFAHRKLLPEITRRDSDDCVKKCKKDDCPSDCGYLLPPPPPHLQAEMIRKSLLITGCMVSVVFVLCLVFMITKRYFAGRADRRRFRDADRPILFDTQDESFADEDHHGAVADHHVWFINTVGLPQSVIDSITLCNYNAAEGLIDGTECSVCLSEFEEDESVRLLPKCSHAFHVHCIDTWLRSHKNCPLCRAPIVCRNASETAASWPSEPGRDSGESDDARVENPANVESGETSRASGEGSASRASLDLGRERLLAAQVSATMRRSVSMDANSAVAIHRAVASVVSDIGSSDSRLIKPVKGSGLGLLKLRMKRSSSSGRRVLASRHRRTQSSIIIPSRTY